MGLNLSPLASDNFTRANENPLSQGGKWSQDSAGDSELQIVSDLCEAAALGNCAELYTGYSLPNDQYQSTTASAITIVAVLGIRVTDTGIPFRSLPGYQFNVESGWQVTRAGTNILHGSLTISSGDVFTIAVVGTTIYVLQNSTLLGSVTDATYASGKALLGVDTFFSVGETQFSNFVIGSAAITTSSISGNAGIAGATVSYSGAAVGSVTADASGNYTISGLGVGSYKITPSLAGYVFSPTSSNQTIVSSNITGVNFTATAAYWSQPDCRQAVKGFGPGPNTGVTVNGTIQYTGQVSDNPAIPGIDSRAAGAPEECGTPPQNNRNNPLGI